MSIERAEYSPGLHDVYVGKIRVTGNKPEICTRTEFPDTAYWKDLFSYWFKNSVACVNCSSSLADQIQGQEEADHFARFYQEIIWSRDCVLIKEVPRMNYYRGWYRLWFPDGVESFRDKWAPYVPFGLFTLTELEKTHFRSVHPTRKLPIGKLRLKGQFEACYHGISYGWHPSA